MWKLLAVVCRGVAKVMFDPMEKTLSRSISSV